MSVKRPVTSGLFDRRKEKNMRGEGIVPVMEVGNNGNGGFAGYGNGDWAWIIVLFLIFGWGRNGFGGNGGFGGSGV
jgi:hypothetical protein